MGLLDEAFPEIAGKRARPSAVLDEAFPELKPPSAVPVRGQDLEETFQEIAQATTFGAAPGPPSMPASFTPEGDLSIAGAPPPPATALARLGLRPSGLIEQAEQPAGFRPPPRVAEREARVAAEAEDLRRGAPVYGPEGRPTYVAPETLPIPEHARRAAIRAIYGPNIAGTTGTAMRYFTQVLGLGQTEAGQAIRETGKKIEGVAEEVGRQYASGYEGRHVIDDPSLVLDPRWLASGFVETALSMAPGFVVGAGAIPTVRALGTTLRLSPDVVLRLARLGGALGFSATGGFQEGAGTYREVLGRGGSEADAAKSATVFGLASMALNTISAERFFRQLPAGGRAKLVRFLTTGTLEAVTEPAEEPIEAFVLGDDAWKALKEGGLDVAVPAFLTGLVAPAAGGRLAPRRGLTAPAAGAERIIAASEAALRPQAEVAAAPVEAPAVLPPDEAAALRDFLAQRAGERPEPPGPPPPGPAVAPRAPAETLAESAARRRAETTAAIRGVVPAPQPPAPAPQRPAGEEFRAAAAPEEAPGAITEEEAARVPTLPPAPPPVATGRQMQIRTPAGRKYDVRFEIVEAQDLLPSHDPFTFGKTPGYPEGVQNRPYHSDRMEQAKVIRQSQDFDPLFLISPQPSSGGTPIVAPTSDVVLSGNSRAMTLLRLRGTPDFQRYVDELRRMAPVLGVDPASLAQAREPVVVRRLVGLPEDLDTLRRFAKETNEGFRQALSQEAQAVTQGRAISAETLDWVAGQLDSLGEAATLKDLLRSSRDREIIRRFLTDGVWTERDVSRYVDARAGLLNDEGRRLVERSVLGSAVPDSDLLQVAPDMALDKIGRALGAVAKVKAAGPGWDLSAPLTGALRTLTDLRARGMRSVDELRRQAEIVPGPAADPRADAVARALLERTPTEFRRAMDRYAMRATTGASGQAGFGFEPTLSPTEAFSESFGMPSSAMRAAEAGGASRTAAIEAPPRAQPEGPQVSTQIVEPSSSMRETVPLVREGPARIVGAIDPTSGHRILQADVDRNRLLAEAERLRQGFEGLLRHAAEATGNEFVSVRVKDAPSLERKIETKGRPADTISDFLGGRIAVRDYREADRVVAELSRRRQILDDDNFFEAPRPDGYRARHVQIEIAPGFSAEVQLVPREIMEVQPRAHQRRDQYRDVTEATGRAREDALRLIEDNRRDFEVAWQQHLAAPRRPGLLGRARAVLAAPTPEDFDLPPADLSRAEGGFMRTVQEVGARAQAMAFGEAPPPYEGEKPPWQFTQADMVEVQRPAFPRGSFRGELKDASGNFVGNVYLADGRVQIGLPREYGRGEIVKMLPGSFDPKDFEKAGGLQVSASRRVQFYRFKKAPAEAPRYEPTPLGDQALVSGTPARAIPPGPTRAPVPQRPVGETPLFRTEAEAEQPRLPGVEERRPAYEAPAPPFFSQLQRVIEQKMPERAFAPQVDAIIRSGGVKADEIKWTGLDDWLRQQGGRKLTKTEVLDFLRANEVRVEEVTKGAPEARGEWKKTALNQWVADDGSLLDRDFRPNAKPGEEYKWTLKRAEGGENTWVGGSFDQAKYIAGQSGRAEPKFSRYVLPGAAPGTYRELLLTLPRTGSAEETLAQQHFGKSYSALDSGERDFIRREPGEYRSPHWDEPNVLAHVRFNERTDAEGKRVLFIEELQSDWHQEGRKKGYGLTDLPAEHYAVERQTLGERGERWVVRDLETGRAVDEGATADEARRRVLDFLNTGGPGGRPGQGGAVPPAPFAKTWHELALKRMLRYAAEQGYDRVAWTSGSAQAERYDLSKQVESVTAKRLIGRPGEEPIYDLTAIDRTGRNHELGAYPADGLDRVVGKDLARSIASQDEEIHRYRGLDLKVGGEGMRAFYDRIVPEFLNKYGKKWGARVGEAEIVGGQLWEVKRTDMNQFVGSWYTREEAARQQDDLARQDIPTRLIENRASETGPLRVPTLDITEAMRRSVMEEGQSLFQPATYARRPDATPETDRQGQLALFDLEAAARRSLSSETGSLARREPTPGARTLGVGFTAEAIHKELLETGTANLRGQTVESEQDLAVLAQVLRDPRFETFRVFYVKDGRIVGQEALTSRMPGYAAAFVSEDYAGELRQMGDRMRALGADSYWLMHNHPSGDAKMSGADAALTAKFADGVPGFRGHVVIDSGEYGVLLPGAEPTKVPLPGAGPDRLLTPAISHRMLGIAMTTPEEVARVGAAVKAPTGWAVLLYRSGNRVRAIQDIPVADLLDGTAGAAWIREQTRAFGSQDVFLYAPMPDATLRLVAKDLIVQRVLLDYVAPTKAGAIEGTATFEDIQRAGRLESLPPAVRVEAPESPYDRDREVVERVRAYGQRHPRAQGYEAWAEAMRQDLGPQVSPYLERAWRETEAPVRGRPARPVPAGQAEPEAPRPPAPPGPAPAGPARPEVGPPALTEPIVRSDLHRRTVKAAGEAFEREGIARDERRWPVLSDQIVQMIREGQVRDETLEAVTRANGLTLLQFGEGLYRLGIGEAARRMQALSALQRSLNRLAGREHGEAAKGLLALADQVARIREEEADTESADHALSWWRRADNVRRGLLVTQLATAVRNYETQVGRMGLDVLDQALQRVFGGTQADPWAALRALTDSLSQVRPTRGGAQARRASQGQIDAVLEAFPRQWDRLFGTYASDIRRAREQSGRPLTGGDRILGAAEQVVDTLNFFNRFQEYATRRGTFWAWLDSRLKRRGIDSGALLRGERRLDEAEWEQVEHDVRFSVDKALEMSFARQPAYGTIGWHFVRMVNRLPVILTGPIPFPRFMVESLRFQYEFSPLPLLTGRIFTEAERAKFRAGDYQTISRMTLGTAALLAAWAVREGQDDDKRWYEVEAPGVGTVDIRPFNPFASYFFVGEIIKRARAGTLYKIESADLIRGIASANVRGGLGLFALDKVVQGLGQLAQTGRLADAMKSAGGEIISGLLVPLRTLTDLYAEYDPEFAVTRERREEPLLGPAKAQFGVGEPLYRPTRAAPERREATGLRQTTGLTVVSEKNALERELDRFQFTRQEILPSTGVPEADNLLAKHMGQLAEERIVPQIGQPFYTEMRPGAQQDWLRRRLGTIRSLARIRARAEARDLFGEVKQRREPARRRLMLEERRQDLDRALAPVP